MALRLPAEDVLVLVLLVVVVAVVAAPCVCVVPTAGLRMVFHLLTRLGLFSITFKIPLT